MHMICNSTDAERLYFILLCDSAHERPKSLLDFAHEQRFAIFGAKNTVDIKRREGISHGTKPNFNRPSGTHRHRHCVNAEMSKLQRRCKQRPSRLSKAGRFAYISFQQSPTEVLIGNSRYRERPFKSELGVVVSNAFCELRRIELAHLIENLGTILERLEPVSKHRGNI
jgi:hypothetical protein